MSQAVRETQRVPRSCTECARRKIKCSKTIPCVACNRRGDSLTCAREAVRVNGKITIAVDSELDPDQNNPLDKVMENNRQLRARVRELEALLHKSDPGITDLFSPSSNQDTPSQTLPSEDIISTFESLHVEEEEAEATSPEAINDFSIYGDQLLSLIPDQDTSEHIVKSSLEALGWIHCAIDVPRFMRQHTAFWAGLNLHPMAALQDHSWMALYLSILSTGAYFLDHLGVSMAEFSTLAFTDDSKAQKIPQVSQAWYKASLMELNNSDFTGTPVLSTVQTLAILSLVHRKFGQSQREYSLLGLAINIARLLGMDRLAHESASLNWSLINSCWLDHTCRDIGRRLWWTLVICDWMKLTSKQSNISPRSFSSALSIAEDSSHYGITSAHPPPSMHGRELAPSPLAIHIVMAKLAYIMYMHNNTPGLSDVARIRKALQEINLLKNGLPQHLVQQSDPRVTEPGLPSWVPSQRSHIGLLLNVNSISLCLSFFPHMLEVGDDKFGLKEHGLRAATTIVAIRQKDPTPYLKKFWGTRSCTLAAGIYLALDLVCFKSEKSAVQLRKQVKDIEFCTHILQQGSDGHLGGSERIQRLMDTSNNWPSGKNVDMRSLREAMQLAATTPIPLGKSDFAFPMHLDIPTDLAPSNSKDKELFSQMNDFGYENVPSEFSDFGQQHAFPSPLVMDYDGMVFSTGSSMPEIDSTWNPSTLFDFF